MITIILIKEGLRLEKLNTYCVKKEGDLTMRDLSYDFGFTLLLTGRVGSTFTYFLIELSWLYPYTLNYGYVGLRADPI